MAKPPGPFGGLGSTRSCGYSGQRTSLLVRLIMQNRGGLAKTRRDRFSQISDDEVARKQKAIAKEEA
jgi:hypothetical protein